MKTYIVDIDGTLADLSHRLHYIQKEPKDWDGFFSACADDAPIQDVIDVIRAISFYGQKLYDTEIIYLTGRPERVRGETTEWLSKYGLPSGELIMRKDGDHRPDTQAKRELLGQLIERDCEIVGVFEDRPSVCRVWRELGLTVFQVGSGEEF